MSEVHPLYVHQAQPHHVQALKDAKATLEDLPLVRLVEAQPGQGTRVISFLSHPNWACESFRVQSPLEASTALLWALKGISGPPLDGADIRGYAGFLETIFGNGVKEVFDE